MRCPKCGFHSFDYLDSCKKCGGDLTELKLRFKFQGYVAPAAAAAGPEPVEDAPVLPAMAEVENEAIDFGFDVLEESPTPELPALGHDRGDPAASFDDFAAVDPAAIDLAADSGLILEQPFGGDEESGPNDDLPKRDKRFDF
jgi:hypothetical protein